MSALHTHVFVSTLHPTAIQDDANNDEMQGCQTQLQTGANIKKKLGSNYGQVSINTLTQVFKKTDIFSWWLVPQQEFEESHFMFPVAPYTSKSEITEKINMFGLQSRPTVLNNLH